MKGASQGLGLQTVIRDIGLQVKLHICTDSSAAKCMTSRVGLGKTRHVVVDLLWVQLTEVLLSFHCSFVCLCGLGL